MQPYRAIKNRLMKVDDPNLQGRSFDSNAPPASQGPPMKPVWEPQFRPGATSISWARRPVGALDEVEPCG